MSIERVAAIALAAMSVVAVAQAQHTYALTDLGTLGGIQSRGYSINEAGQVSGSASDSSQRDHAFLYSGGSMMNLGTLGGPTSDGFAINNLGDVAGGAEIATQFRKAFLYTGGTMQNIGTLPGGSTSNALGINDSGMICGYSTTGAGYHAFRWSGGVMTDLGTLGGPQSFAYAINASGVVVGTTDVASGPVRAFRCSVGGPMENLGSLGGQVSVAYAINSMGQVVGYSETPGNQTLAFLYSKGTIQSIGTLGGNLSRALGINDSTEIVGMSTGSWSGFHAFLRSGSTMYDLNSLVNSTAAGWTLLYAYDINNAGQITGSGLAPNGEERAFILTPIPDKTISGTVQLQDYSATAGTQVTLDIRQPGTQTIAATRVVTLDGDGNFSCTAPIAAGNYAISVKGSHWLRKTLGNQTVSSSGITGLSFSLMNGDINGNNVISLSDFGLLRAAFGSSSGSGNWNPNADLNGDGAVSLGDFAIFRRNFGQEGDE